jgi:RNA polymerase sigma-70 factor (ECF subfamily)
VTADPGGIAELYAEQWAPLVGLLVSVGGSRADAEEVAQEAFEKLVHSWHRIRGYDDPAAWVRQVAVRTLISRHRRSRVAEAARGRVAATDRVDGLDDAATDRADVAAAMERLTMEHRAVVLLHYVHDLPVDAVARELRVPAGTVKSRLSRARAALAEHLRVPMDDLS